MLNAGLFSWVLVVYSCGKKNRIRVKLATWIVLPLIFMKYYNAIEHFHQIHKTSR
jgi:hypothetical protein